MKIPVYIYADNGKIRCIKPVQNSCPFCTFCPYKEKFQLDFIEYNQFKGLKALMSEHSYTKINGRWRQNR